jgi:alpha-tubulin suppressor-like RCC1 family protein
VLVGGGLEVVALYVGVAHACMTLGSGEAYCWGRNAHGELGSGMSGGASGIPVKVKAIGNELFDALAPGEAHTCALTTSGLVYCWGDNSHGQLGNGTATPSTVPVMVLPPQ